MESKFSPLKFPDCSNLGSIDHKRTMNSYEAFSVLISRINLKIGITTDCFQTYGRQSEKEYESGFKTISDGHGDFTFSIKQNLIGND